MYGKTYTVNTMEELLKLFDEFETLKSERNSPEAETKIDVKTEGDTIESLRREIELLKAEIEEIKDAHDENADKISEMFKGHSDSIEVLLQFAKFFIEKEYGGECDCDCESVGPEVGKWYLTWDNDCNFTDAEVRSFVGVNNKGEYIYIDSPEDNKNHAISYDNYAEIDESMIGKFLANGNLETGKLYYVYDDDGVSSGYVMYATSKKRTFTSCKSDMNKKDYWEEFENVRVIDKRTLGRG